MAEEVLEVEAVKEPLPTSRRKTMVVAYWGRTQGHCQPPAVLAMVVLAAKEM